MKSRIFLIVFLLLLVSAAMNVASAELVTVRGEATIFNGDIAAAREEALVDAQRNALEQVLGVKIKSETAVQDFMLADDTILTMISGYVKSSKIVSEKQEQEFLVLEVECDVAAELTDEEAQKLMRNFSCVVGFTTEVDGERVDDERLTNKLSAELVKAGFDVRDAAQLLARDEIQQHFLAALERQDTEAARWIGRRLLSNVVIIGKTVLKQREKKEVMGFSGPVNVYVYDSWLDARAIEAESGQIIAQHAADLAGVPGTGDTPEKAMNDALTKAERAFSKDLLAQLTAYGGRKSRPITVEVEGIPTLEEFQRVKQFLTNVRFRDSEVLDLGFEAEQTSTFRFNYSEKINLVALKLEHLPNLSVTERTENQVICRYSSVE
ncbi:MAG: flagellar assembly protein T N-terminal domain-containing protein [bacterium]